jgi:hypothetical protein
LGGLLLNAATAILLTFACIQGAAAEPGPHAVTDLSRKLMQIYNDRDVAALHGLLAPALKAKYAPQTLEAVLGRCHALTGRIGRLSLPSYGQRHYGFFAVYAEAAIFEMILEIDPDERVFHWVITDDVTAKDQTCQIDRHP